MKRYLLLSIIVIVLASLAVFLFPRSDSQSRNQVGANPENRATVVTHMGTSKLVEQNKRETPYQMKEIVLEKKLQGPMTPERLTFMRERQKMLQRMINEENRPVVVYGQILDQENKGISNVSVELKTNRLFRLADGSVEGGCFVFSVQTDADGRFKIEGFNAIDLSVGSLLKAGYISTQELPQMFEFRNGDWGTYEKPIVFYMWKSRGAEPLIVVSKSIPVDISNGVPLSIDLLTGDISKISTPVTIIINRIDDTAIPEAPYGGAMKYDWSFTLEIPSGGVILTETELAFFAPEKEYARTASFSMNKADLCWSRNMKLNAYIVTGNPPLYSRATFEVTIGEINKDQPSNNESRLRWEFYTNPSGSRNLEYDPEKEIKPDNKK